MKFRRRYGAAIQISLAKIDAKCLQQFSLPVVFNPFRNRAEPQSFRHRHNRSGDGLRILALRQIPNECDVDLEGVDRELPELTQRGVTGTEIVEGDARTERLDFLQLGIEQLYILGCNGLGEFGH